ncbi:MAG: VapE domain-containing protein [Hydrogenophaga sp.]|uniref:VapE domain-containing protein n=1 Tax=Hydrogenophaga sp. TaxID=1904254 RepID=UPI004036FFD8
MNQGNHEALKEAVIKAGSGSRLPSLASISKPLDRDGFPHQPEVSNHFLPGTIENLAHLLKSYCIEVSNDVITKSTTLRMKGVNATSDGMQEAILQVIMSLAALNRMQSSPIPGYITALAKGSERNCAEDWIRSKEWDGVDRVGAITDTVRATEGFPKFLKRCLIHKWLRSMVAAATQPGFSARGVLTFQGGQGVGKTSWFKKLIDHKELRELLLKVDHHLDVHNKDSKLGAIKHWAVELGELDSTLGRDFARLKGFLTSSHDKIRKPYARLESEYQRRTVFFASVNEFNFLEDSTGNTRFWTIPVESINYHHDIDMQQLYAQLLVEVERGEEWWLDKEEEAFLEQENRKHRSVSVIRDLIESKIDVDRTNTEGCTAYTAVEVLHKLGRPSATNGEAKECARTLRELLGPSRKIRDRQRWSVPFRATSVYEEFHRVEEAEDRY